MEEKEAKAAKQQVATCPGAAAKGPELILSDGSPPAMAKLSPAADRATSSNSGTASYKNSAGKRDEKLAKGNAQTPQLVAAGGKEKDKVVSPGAVHVNGMEENAITSTLQQPRRRGGAKESASPPISRKSAMLPLNDA
jgi:hypothetical protein